MLKKFAAAGLCAALALSPLAALAQADTTTPAAPAAGAASTDTGTMAPKKTTPPPQGASHEQLENEEAHG